MDKKKKPEDHKRIPNNNGIYHNRIPYFTHNSISFNRNTNTISKSSNYN
jgi:hypothetical protein